MVVYSPKNIKEAIEYLDKNNNDKITIMMGGTDLMVRYNAKIISLENVLNAYNINELKKITHDNETISFGSGVTYSDLIAHKQIEKEAPLLKYACSTVGSIQIRNRGTIGGNIMNASPAGDSLPSLAVLDSILVLESVDGKREVPFKEFFKGSGQTVRSNKEILTQIKVEKIPEAYKYAFYKIGTRQAQSISKVSLAGIINYENNIIKKVKLSLGAVASTVIFATKTMEFLLNKEITKHIIDDAVKIIKDEATPIDDIRSTANYRKNVAGNLLKKFLIETSQIEY